MENNVLVVNRGGVLTAWDNDIDEYAIRQEEDSTDRILVTCFNLPGNPICIVNCYLPSGKASSAMEKFREDLDKLGIIVEKYAATYEILITGDVNVDHYNRTGTKETLWTDWLRNNNTSDLNDPGKIVHTYQNDALGHMSYLDQFFVISKDTSRWNNAVQIPEVDSPEIALNMSTHTAIAVQVNTGPMRKSEEKTVNSKRIKYRWAEANKVNFATSMEDSLQDKQAKDYDAHDAIGEFVGAMEKAAQIAVPHKIIKLTNKANQPKNSIWSPEIAEAKLVSLAAGAAWTANGKIKGDSFHAAVKLASKNFRAAQRRLEAARRDELYKDISVASATDKNLMHRIINRQKSKSATGTLLLVDGVLTADKCIQRNGLAKYCCDLATPKATDRMDNMREHIRILTERMDDTVPLDMLVLKKAVNQLNSNKAVDKHCLAAEHLKLAINSEAAATFLLETFNEMLEVYRFPEIIKESFKLPIPKPKKITTIMDNYRGINIPHLIMKLAEAIGKVLYEDDICYDQADTQFGFTKGRSPYMASLLITEAAVDAMENSRELYVCSLDARKAFDVVRHGILMFKLFHTKISSAGWKMVNEIYTDIKECVRWFGDSETYEVNQGVKQGGILSTILYKCYGNDNPINLLNCDLGYKIGNINIGNPVVADDSALLSSDPFELQSMMNLSHFHSEENQYELHPIKSVVTIMRQNKANMDSLFTWYLGDSPASLKSEFEHLGLIWEEQKLSPNVEARISTTRKASYKAMGYGLHNNGVDPQAAIGITNMQIISKLLSGLKATILSNSDSNKIDSFFHKMLKQIQGLPDNTAREAVYILAGEMPIEEKLELEILEIYGGITRLLPNHVLQQLARRQIAIKSKTSKSWFIKATNIATKYNIDGCGALTKPKTQAAWKRECIVKVWSTVYHDMYDRARSRSTLAWMILKNPTKTYCIHEIWATCLGSPKQAEAARIRARLLVGRYGLNKNRAKYRPGSDSSCPMCHYKEEDETHFIAVCKSSRFLVREPLSELLDMFKKEGLPTPQCSKEITSAVLNGHQFIMKQDFGEYVTNEGVLKACFTDENMAVQLKEKGQIIAAHQMANNIVARLHKYREEALKLTKDSCIECMRKVTNDDMALSCDGCLRWQHIICNDIASEEEYHMFMQSRAILQWKCRRCSKN